MIHSLMILYSVPNGKVLISTTKVVIFTISIIMANLTSFIFIFFTGYKYVYVGKLVLLIYLILVTTYVVLIIFLFVLHEIATQ